MRAAVGRVFVTLVTLQWHVRERFWMNMGKCLHALTCHGGRGLSLAHGGCSKPAMTLSNRCHMGVHMGVRVFAASAAYSWL